MKHCKRCEEEVCLKSTCYCERHLEDNRRYLSNLISKRKKLKLCVSCGKPLAATSKRWCIVHLEKHRHTQKNRPKPTKKKRCLNKFRRLKNNAKKRNIEVCMSEQEFFCWLKQQPESCYYCDVKSEELLKIGRSKGFLSIDRKNNDLPYTEGNICLACMRCNNLKSNFFTENEWIEICERFIKPKLSKYHAGNLYK